jgi:predicted HAD superfamily Cof-like phosphohydrolase
MNPYQLEVAEFHRANGQPIGHFPAIRDRDLRAKLIMEEAVETVAAMGYSAYASVQEPGAPGQTATRHVGFFAKSHNTPQFTEAVDGLCDLLYVTFGTAVAWGIDIDPFFAEVQRANMTKLGGGKRADGKVLKPAGWTPPDHAPILARQMANPAEVRHERMLNGEAL